jgi:hypothetical protein
MKLDNSDLPWEGAVPDTIDGDEAVRLAEETFGIKAEARS